MTTNVTITVPVILSISRSRFEEKLLKKTDRFQFSVVNQRERSKLNPEMTMFTCFSQLPNVKYVVFFPWERLKRINNLENHLQCVGMFIT